MSSMGISKRSSNTNAKELYLMAWRPGVYTIDDFADLDAEVGRIPNATPEDDALVRAAFRRNPGSQFERYFYPEGA
jgi:hypothetical protein